MTTLTEGKHAGEFLVSEANKTRSRDVGVLVSGQDCVAGTVLGKITASGKYTILAPAATDGSEAAAALLFDAVDASTGDATCVLIARDAEFNADEIVWPNGATTNQKATATGELAGHGLIAR